MCVYRGLRMHLCLCVCVCLQVLQWTTDIVRTANSVQLEMDPHQRTTHDYEEHHKQRQAQSALEMAMREADEDGSEEDDRGRHRH